MGGIVGFGVFPADPILSDRVVERDETAPRYRIPWRLWGGRCCRARAGGAPLVWQRPTLRHAQPDPTVGLPYRLVHGRPGFGRRPSSRAHHLPAMEWLPVVIVRAERESYCCQPCTAVLFRTGVGKSGLGNPRSVPSRRRGPNYCV